MTAGDPIAIHWTDAGRPKVARGTLVHFSGLAVVYTDMFAGEVVRRAIPWDRVTKVRKIT